MTEVSNCMSRFVELKPIKSVSASECAEKLIEFFGQNGTPEELLSDRNKEFVNNLVKQLMRLTGVKSKYSIPYSHQDNSLVHPVCAEHPFPVFAVRV